MLTMIKKLLKRICLWIRFKLRPNDEQVKKEMKKVKKREKFMKNYSLWGKICLYLTGLNDLKIREA